MGKRLIQQRRGKGTSTYRAKSFRFKGKLSFGIFAKNSKVKGEIKKILHSKGHTAPLMKVMWETKKESLLPAFVGAYEGQIIYINQKDEVSPESLKQGNAYMIKNIPQGTAIFNIELTPGDSGTLVKSAGSFAIIVSHLKKTTKILLPSKKEKLLNSKCRAFIGRVGGSGRHEKPFLKAGLKSKEMKKKNKLYPRVSGVAMNAVDHPFGGSRSMRKGKPTIAPKNAPPGRKVGMVRPKHTGRNK